jgi:hypothetical protein
MPRVAMLFIYLLFIYKLHRIDSIKNLSASQYAVLHERLVFLESVLAINPLYATIVLLNITYY